MDNKEIFKNWGFERDSQNMWMLHIFREDTLQRDTFHIPSLSKIGDRKLDDLIRNNKFRYSLNLRNYTGKNALDKIKNKEQLSAKVKSKLKNLLIKGMNTTQELSVEEYNLSKILKDEIRKFERRISGI